MWLRAHCVDAATLEPLTASRYVYVELRTTDNLLVRRIKILQRGGVYAGYLPLPATLAQDEYVLCAYTLYMRNLGGDYLFSKPLSVNPYRQPEKRRRRTAAGPFDVAFFPEGGYLIDGQPCRGVQGTGQGRTFAAGDGNRARRPWPHRRVSPRATPAWGRSSSRRGPAGATRPNASRHRAARRGASTCPKPTTSPSSCASSPTTPPSSYPSVRLKVAAAGLKLLVHRCGTQCYYKEWNPQHASLTFLRDELPGGLYQILLLSPTGEAYSERLVFNRRDDEAEVTMRQEGTLRQRSKVTLHFEVRDTKRRPAQGDFAVAVTDRKAAAPVAAAGIYSTLMLSELRGVIEDPDWYFAPDNAQGDEGLDELLLTQGWRRYDVPKLLRNEYEEPYYPLEAGQEIAGRIERTAMFSKKKKLDRYTMRLLVPRSGYATSAPIAEDGSFALNGFDFPDSTTCAAAHRPRADDHRRADSHHSRFVSRVPHAAPAAARSDLRGAGAEVYRAARHGGHAEYRHRHRGRDGQTLGRRHRRKRAGTPSGRTVVERRADQGGQRRDDPRLHREDARNAGHGTKGTIPWPQTGLYGRRSVRGNGRYVK